MAWTDDELARLGRAEELRIAGRRDDGSLRRLVIIWAVVVGDDVFVRSVRGPQGAWFRGVQQRHEGRIESGGVAKDVRFTDVAAEDAVQAAIDDAYADKYPHHPGPVADITTAEARGTTLRVEPPDQSKG